MALMNLKTIEKKLSTLKQSKESIEKKKADAMKLYDGQIAELTKQINSYDKVRIQIEKLMKMQEEQMQMAAELELEFSGKKQEKIQPAQLKEEIIEEVEENSEHLFG